MRRLVLLLLWSVVHANILMASDAAMQEGKALIEKAEAKTDIFALPSFEMKATVRMADGGKSLDGSYVLLWNGPEQWREEISLPGYSEVRVGSKGLLFLKRSTDFIPVPISQLRSALGFESFSHATLRQGETIKRIQRRKLNGSQASCVEISGDSHLTREVCVDDVTGVLIRQSPFLDKELIPVGTKVFPHILSYVRNDKHLVDVEVSELKATDLLPPSSFEPPTGATVKPGCMNPSPSPAHLIELVRPIYPEHERLLRNQGTVSINALINKDGSVSGLRIVSGVTPGLNEAALDSVRKWHYEPPTCDGVAVDIETLISVDFRLQR